MIASFVTSLLSSSGVITTLVTFLMGYITPFFTNQLTTFFGTTLPSWLLGS